MNDPLAESTLPDVAEYVLPARPRPAGEVVVTPPAPDASVLRRGGEVARRLGERFAVLAESQQLFCAELRERLQAFDAAIAEATRAQLKGAMREIVHVLEWQEATQRDLLAMAQRATQGHEPVDLGDLCSGVAARVRNESRFVECHGGAAGTWWGEAAALHDAVHHAVDLVTERTGGKAAIALGVEAAEGAFEVTIRSRGEVVDEVDPVTAQRFRAAAERVGARVCPDVLGPAAPGLRLRLPAATD